jgi:hypothetical protein
MYKFVIMTILTTFAVAAVSSVSPLLVPTSGQSILTLFGKNFAFPSSLRAVSVGISSCTAVLFTSDTSISCTASHGWGPQLLVLLNVNGVQGVSSATVNFSGNI